ncbi:Na(+)/H(+) antiporter subunit B [Helicovermis profundi]|uniref:MrpA C-terminal/MbhD domain-containing protein n=1 Tax=Helicovermis profundi TaxID=3065157 RepID=A0AAU9E1G1_9FIRM|nr:hypothetical protein HLPR_04490 [Clostridia bacterium S502]
MYIKYVLMTLLLFLSLIIILEKNNFKLIVFFSVFSLISASLYFYNFAPDVALAEVAVGSAFVPLIFLIAISKQRTFTVMSTLKKNFEYNKILVEFCIRENLKLKIIDIDSVTNDESRTIHGVFRRKDIDLIVNYDEYNGKYEMIGKKTNILLNELDNSLINFSNIELIRILDEEMKD